MAEFSMWGPAENGTRLADQDAMARQLQGVAMQQHAASARLTSAQADEAQMKMQMERAQMQILQQQAMKRQQAQQPGNPERTSQDDRQASQMFEDGQMLIDAGFLDKGAKMIQAASMVMQRTASAEHLKATTEEAKAKTAFAKADMIERLTRDVHDDQSLQEALNEYKKIYPDSKIPDGLASAKYSPELLRHIQSRAISAKDMYTERMQARREDRYERAEDRREKTSEAQLAISQAQLKIAQARETRLEKNGGAKSTTTARTPPEDVKAVTNLIRAEYPDLKKDDPALLAESAFVAAQAQSLIKASPGLSRDEALQRAYQTAKQNGDITSAKQDRGFWDVVTGKDAKSKTTIKPGSHSQQPVVSPPKPGDVMQGYKFKGGDPSKKENWEQVK